jgi:uncharacterized protein YdhG (YjbR/CyaY superfamily)
VGTTAETIDDYISALPLDARPVLERICQIVRRSAPKTGEKISYGMPTFTPPGGQRIYVAAWKQHVSLHALPRLEPPLEDRLRRYRSGNGTVRLPLDEPVPYELIESVVATLADPTRPT